MRLATGVVSTSQRLERLTSHLQAHQASPITTATTMAQQAAPWRKLFLSDLGSMEPAGFTLSTIRRAAPSASGGARERRSSILVAPQYFPRSRTCIFRGLWAHLPVNPKNEAPLNPSGVWETELLTFTTDARMDKMEELWEDGINLDSRAGRGTDPGSPTTGKVGEELWEEGLARMRGKTTKEPTKDPHDKLKGSGGGAVVEALFWAREHGVQWRVRGRAYVLAPDIESSPEGREVMSLLRSRMRCLPSLPSSSSPSSPHTTGEEKEWSFAREITAHFGNLSPLMRGSFRNPPPGQPVSSPPSSEEGGNLLLGQKVTDLHDPVARANFRVVVIVPDELDQTDLSDPEHGRRWIHTFVGLGHGKEHGGWQTVEVWP